MKTNPKEKLYEVHPEYFHLGSDTILFLDAQSLADFLNYSEYKSTVISYDRPERVT